MLATAGEVAGRLLNVPAIAPEADACGFAAVGSTQERLYHFISLQSTHSPLGPHGETQAGLITKPYNVAVQLLRNNVALLTCIRPHANPVETPFLPFPIFFASSLDAAVQTHGIYLLVVYRVWYLNRYIIDNVDVPIAMRLTAADWCGAHALLALYITAQYPAGSISPADKFSKISDATLTTVCEELFDAPADMYGASPRTIITAGNSLPDLSKDLLTHFLAMCPGSSHPFYSVPKKNDVNTPAAAFIVIASKLVPGRCLRRGGKDLILLWWHHLYHIIRISVAMVCMNAYRDSNIGAKFGLQQQVVQRLWLCGCGGGDLTGQSGSEAMKAWFVSNNNVQELVMHAIQRYTIYLLESMPAAFNVIGNFYTRTASACFHTFRTHVKRVSVQVFEHLNTHNGDFSVLEQFTCPTYDGIKLPKQVGESNLIRVRDIDNNLLGVDQCRTVHGLSSELFLVINYALHVRNVPPDVLLYHLAPQNQADAKVWRTCVAPCVSQALVAKKVDALKLLEPLTKTPMGHRALHITRALLIHTSMKTVRIVRLPYGDYLRQVIALHRNHGHVDPVRPILGTLPPVRYADTDVTCAVYQESAAATLQSTVRRFLVQNWWSVDLRGFVCCICGKIQLPPHQRVLYKRCMSDDGTTATFCVTCGEARRNKRSNQFRRVRGGGRQPNKAKASRTKAWANWCEHTPLSSFNLIGFAPIIDNKMYQACTRCVSVVVVDPRLWTHGEYFLCPSCCHADSRHMAGPRCMKCRRSGIADKKTLALHPWAKSPITYVGFSAAGGSVRKLQEGFICDDRTLIYCCMDKKGN